MVFLSLVLVYRNLEQDGVEITPKETDSIQEVDGCIRNFMSAVICGLTASCLKVEYYRTEAPYLSFALEKALPRHQGKIFVGKNW